MCTALGFELDPHRWKVGGNFSGGKSFIVEIEAYDKLINYLTTYLSD